MKHCLLVTVYKDVEVINKLIKLLPPQFDVYVHIDRKSSVRISDIDVRAHVVKVNKIYWGSISHLKSFLLLMRKAFRHKYDYYHLISGADFIPIPIDRFDKICVEKNIYMEVHPIPWKKDWWESGYGIVRNRTLASYCDIRFGWRRKLNKLFILFQKKFHMTRSLPPYPLYGGSVYCSLPHEAIYEILNSSIGCDLLNRLENSTCGEEIYFQTLLANSPLKGKIVNNNLRYMDWRSVPVPPKVLDEEDYEKIRKREYLFCRKLDSQKSKLLLDILMRRITTC